MYYYRSCIAVIALILGGILFSTPAHAYVEGIECGLSSQNNGNTNVTWNANSTYTCSSGECGTAYSGARSYVVLNPDTSKPTTYSEHCNSAGCGVSRDVTYPTAGTYGASIYCEVQSGTGYLGSDGFTRNVTVTSPTPTISATPTSGGGGPGTPVPTPSTCNPVMQNGGYQCTAGHSISEIVNQSSANACLAYCKTKSATLCQWYSGNGNCYVSTCSTGYPVGAGGWFSAPIPAACYPPVSAAPLGNFDITTCALGAQGWTFDPDFAGATNIDIYLDAPAAPSRTPIATITSNNLSRPDVNTWAVASGYSPPNRTNTGFTWPIPGNLRDNTTHTLYLYSHDLNSSGGQLSPLRRVQIPATAGANTFKCADIPTGTLAATCGTPSSTATGTAVDAQGSPVQVTLFDGPAGMGGVQIGAGFANPNYSISFPTFNDGLTHTLYAYAQGIPAADGWHQIGSQQDVTCAPTVELSAAATSVTYGTATTLSWSVKNATSCTASPNGWFTAPVSGTSTGNNVSTGPLTASTIYTITCSNASASATKSVTVGVNIPPPTATITDISDSDYCSGGAGMNISWQYNSVALPIQKYRVEVLNGGTTIFDTGEVIKTALDDSDPVLTSRQPTRPSWSKRIIDVLVADILKLFTQ